MTTVAPDPVDVTVEQPNGKRKRGKQKPVATRDPSPGVRLAHTPVDDAVAVYVSMDDLVWTSLNPRKTFDPAELQELANSIRESGLLQPVIVRRHPIHTIAESENARRGGGVRAAGPHWEGYIGERRWRAHQLLGAETIKAIVRDADDATVRRLAAIENLQRVDLPPMEEARAYRDLMADDQTLTVLELAARIGKDASYVHRRLALNNLPERARQLLEEGKLKFRGALEIARINDPETLDTIMKRLEESIKGKYWFDTNEIRRYAMHGLRLMKKAPFSPNDADLVPEAGACTTCPKRTSNNVTLFPDLQENDRCTDGACWTHKMTAFVTLGRPKAQQKAEKMGLSLRAITTEYGDRRLKPTDETPLTRNHYVILGEDTSATRDCGATMLGYVVDSGPYEKLKVGHTVRICTGGDECKVHRPDFGGGRSSSNQLEVKKKERKAQAESEVRRAVLDQGLAKMKWPIATKVPPDALTNLRIIAVSVLDRLYNDQLPALARALDLEYVQHKSPEKKGDKSIDPSNWDDAPRDYHGAHAALRIYIDKLDAPGLMTFLLRMALFGTTQTHGSTDPKPSARLEAFAKRHDIPIARMRTKRLQEWAENEKVRAEKRKASEKRKQEKEAREASKAAGQTEAVAEKPKAKKKKAKRVAA